jgi:hypothetical protein
MLDCFFSGEYQETFPPLLIKRVIIKIHALFCYYAIKRQISTKLIGKKHVLPEGTSAFHSFTI